MAATGRWLGASGLLAIVSIAVTVPVTQNQSFDTPCVTKAGRRGHCVPLLDVIECYRESGDHLRFIGKLTVCGRARGVHTFCCPALDPPKLTLSLPQSNPTALLPPRRHVPPATKVMSQAQQSSTLNSTGAEQPPLIQKPPNTNVTAVPSTAGPHIAEKVISDETPHSIELPPLPQPGRSGAITNSGRPRPVARGSIPRPEPVAEHNRLLTTSLAPETAPTHRQSNDEPRHAHSSVETSSTIEHISIMSIRSRNTTTPEIRKSILGSVIKSSKNIFAGTLIAGPPDFTTVRKTLSSPPLLTYEDQNKTSNEESLNVILPTVSDRRFQNTTNENKWIDAIKIQLPKLLFPPPPPLEPSIRSIQTLESTNVTEKRKDETSELASSAAPTLLTSALSTSDRKLEIEDEDESLEIKSTTTEPIDRPAVNYPLRQGDTHSNTDDSGSASSKPSPKEFASLRCGDGRNIESWTVLVGTRSRWLCGGALIGHRLLLTSARCVAGRSASSLRVRQTNGDNVEVLRVAIHPLHDAGRHDLAILLLHEAASTQGFLCLPTTAKVPVRRGPLAVYGWGISTYGAALPLNNVTATTVKEVATTACDSAYRVLPTYRREFPRGVSKTEICVRVAEEDRRDSPLAGGAFQPRRCPQDRGGPLVETAAKGRQVLVGAMREAAGCGSQVFPNVYTRVAQYANWIRSIAKELRRER